MYRNFTVFIASLVTAGFLFSSTATANVTGRWQCVYRLQSGGDYPSDLVVTQTGNAFVGEGVGTGTNAPFSTVAGLVNGATVTFNYDYINSSYSADVTGTLSGDQMNGTWSSNTGQLGTFTCTRVSGGGGSPTPTPTANPGPSSKRGSAIRIICNRSGDLLTATCAATVGDAGAPPRTTPTGLVRFSSKSGSPSFSAACLLQPTAYSPGVSSCSVPYSPPPGFPIAAAFPLDALYEGDINFDPSATDHQLLFATCVGNATTPCSGAIGLGFGSETIAIIKNALALTAACGKAGSSKRQASTQGNSNDCSFDTEAEVSLVEELGELTADDWRKLAESIKDADADADPVLEAIRKIGNRPANELSQSLQNTLEWARILQSANKQYFKKKVSRSYSPRRGIPRVVIPLGTSKTRVRNGKEKRVAIRVNKRAQRILGAFQRAGITTITVTLKAKVKRESARGARRLSASTEVGIS